jgi:hypothetical protein
MRHIRDGLAQGWGMLQCLMHHRACRASLALEDYHEPIASGFIAILMIGTNDLQKARKIILHETIQALRWQMLGQPRVALHIGAAF